VVVSLTVALSFSRLKKSKVSTNISKGLNKKYLETSFGFLE